MISEKTICELFSSRLPSGRLNTCFESDAEIIPWPIGTGLFTTDEFSAEDLFRENCPYSLGWNIASGAISDILACGGTPLYYAHALTVGPDWDLPFLERLCDGVRDVLLAAGVRFIGGDCGRAKLWRCTASVLGTCAGSPVRRRGATSGDRVYLTGPIGAGNLEAALCLAQSQPRADARLHAYAESVQTRFPVRLKESGLLRDFASAAIDTSDGVCSGLNTLADLNGCGYAVRALPYSDEGARTCERIGWPKTLLFLGECGEYELMFTVRPDREAALLTRAAALGCQLHCLGEMTSCGRSLLEPEGEVDLSTLNVAARDFETPQHYLAALAAWLERRP